jgi:exodeoxyribonuclease VII large subunit
MADSSIPLSELLARVAGTLRETMPGPFWIIAEILEMHVNQRGHCYLELVEKNPDDHSILARARATIWASKFNMLRPYFEASTGTPLKSGLKILCRGTVEFHPQFGFSINLTDIDPAYTLGDLARKKQEVIRKLREEGVMDMNREIPFPTVPQNIAVISSEGAAGYGDFMDTLYGNSHGYMFHTRLFQSVMQGEEAPSSIMRALDRIFGEADRFDCVVIIRGGGSRADLECFNDYELSYYITQFPLPVVTGIGHERDESVADLVAARSLKTPTAVAEFFVDQLLAFEFTLGSLLEQLSSLVSRTVQKHRLLIERYSADAGHLCTGLIRKERERLERSELSLERGAGAFIRSRKDRLLLMETRNMLVDPLNVLKRGYSITLHDGRALTGIDRIRKGDILETRLRDGTVMSRTEKTIQTHGKGKN